MSSAFSDSAEPLEPHEQEQQLPAAIPEPDDVPVAGTETASEGSEAADPLPTPPASPSLEELLPPEARGEANGGPLGCCLGIVVGLLLTAGLFLALANGGTRSFATIPVIFIGTVLSGYLGWRIGKRVYKEYELSPRQKRKLAQQQRRLEQMERKRKRQSSTFKSSL